MTRRRAALPTRRQEQAEVREYAEQLLQALREWRTWEADLPSTSSGPAKPPRFRIVGCGRPSTGAGALRSTTVEYLAMPGPRPYTVSEVTQVIRRMAATPAHAHLAEHLERIRSGRGASSLLRPTGWAPPTSWSQTYALALFTLAVQLGDAEADRCLSLLRARKTQ